MAEKAHRNYTKVRERAVNSIVTVRRPTRIITPSWYTFDASRVLGIANTFAVCTSTCKHETPYKIFVGKRKEGWQRRHKTLADNWIYEIEDLGRELTLKEKNAIYDKM